MTLDEAKKVYEIAKTGDLQRLNNALIEMTEDAPAVLDRIAYEIRGYQGKLNPNLDHDDLITSNAYENVIDIIETHKYLGIPTHNAIIIPENATNGAMIKAMLHPYKICEYKYSVHVYMTEEDFWKADYIINCSTSWWNAPYKAGETREIEAQDAMEYCDSEYDQR